jgi:glutamine synthetase
MQGEELVMVCTSDLAGQVRGKAVPAADLDARAGRGVGWTPTNLMITAHGAIAPGPWGAHGDLLLRPDPATRVRVPFGEDQAPESFVLADAMALDGQPWSCCPRDFLKRALAALAEQGLGLVAAFEHEFAYLGVEERPNSAYNLDSFRRQGRFGEIFVAALRAAGLEPDTFMPEYGPMQYEITLRAAPALVAADRAVILRELARGTAVRLGHRVSFAPLLRPDAVGNGVHIHFSLQDEAGRPVSHDPGQPHGVAARAAAFLEGIRRKVPALCALTAPSTISYLRLVPHRWSAAYSNLGIQDREASLRLCPVFARDAAARASEFHFEYRAADAAASPYLALGAIVWAGVWGLRQNLALAEPTTTDPDAMPPAERDRRGIERLPTTLPAALVRLAADPDLAQALGPDLHAAYLAHKRFEAELMGTHDAAEQCRRYGLAY